MNIYQKIKNEKGYLSALAPMEDVTDTVFRQMLCKIGRPDIFYTEFMNVDGYCSKGRDKVNHRILFSEKERPVIIQLWGNTPEHYSEAVKEILKLKPEGIDINMGCSVKNVLKNGAGSGLIQEQDLAKEIIEAVKKEAKDIPVSVKTRIGYDEVITEEWIGFLLKQGLDVITIHGRISKEGYNVPCRWNEIGKAVELRNEISPETLIIGNGDIQSIEQGLEYKEKYGVDGFMVGRGIMNNPWLFSERKEISKEEKIQTLLDHLILFKETWGDMKPFHAQRKYVKMYISEFEGAGELRRELMTYDSVDETCAFLSDILC